ncbi:hypothetical protein ACIA5E_19120 [Nocardia asteroides]|uniref:hypothetical protein n=1 Tax=Nocardia asteroides TaxID=1824 RepID=UPI0037B5B124
MPASKPRRSKRDPESVRRLDEARELMKVRRSEAERRETATMKAVEVYLYAAGSIRQHLDVRDRRIGELRRQIDLLEREHAAVADKWRVHQASAIAAMREQGESDDGIGQLLELTSRQVRQIAAEARAAEPSASESSGLDRGGKVGRGLDVGRQEVQPNSQTEPNLDTPESKNLA